MGSYVSKIIPGVHKVHEGHTQDTNTTWIDRPDSPDEEECGQYDSGSDSSDDLDLGISAYEYGLQQVTRSFYGTPTSITTSNRSSATFSKSSTTSTYTGKSLQVNFDAEESHETMDGDHDDVEADSWFHSDVTGQNSIFPESPSSHDVSSPIPTILPDTSLSPPSPTLHLLQRSHDIGHQMSPESMSSQQVTSVTSDAYVETSNAADKENVSLGQDGLPLHVKLSVGPYGPVYHCICGRAFTTKRNVSYHKYCDGSEKPFQCDLCAKRFSSKASLNAHSKEAHEKPTLECQICKRKFHRKARYTVHMRMHSGDRPFTCPKCPLTFTSKAVQRQHVMVHDIPPNGLGLKCSICDKAYRSERSLNLHMVLHSSMRAGGSSN